MKKRCDCCKKKIKLKKDLDCYYTVNIEMKFDFAYHPDDCPIYFVDMCRKCYKKWSKKFDKFLNTAGSK